MTDWLTLYAIGATFAVLCAGLVIVFFTVRAARHTGDRGLWLLAFGISLTGVGLLLAGWLPDIVGVNRITGTALTSTLSAIGLVIVVYSMFTEAQIATGPGE
jgi:hypothetical protein